MQTALRRVSHVDRELEREGHDERLVIITRETCLHEVLLTQLWQSHATSRWRGPTGTESDHVFCAAETSSDTSDELKAVGISGEGHVASGNQDIREPGTQYLLRRATSRMCVNVAIRVLVHDVEDSVRRESARVGLMLQPQVDEMAETISTTRLQQAVVVRKYHTAQSFNEIIINLMLLTVLDDCSLDVEGHVIEEHLSALLDHLVNDPIRDTLLMREHFGLLAAQHLWNVITRRDFGHSGHVGDTKKEVTQCAFQC